MRLNQLFSIAFSIAFKNGANYLILREKKFFKKNNAIEQIALNRIFNRILWVFYTFSSIRLHGSESIPHKAVPDFPYLYICRMIAICPSRQLHALRHHSRVSD